MTGTRSAEILRQLEHSSSSDGELLARFAAIKDAQAFAELVRRHGSLVLGVCRRVTGHSQDAEDAFQATFLVLAKKAGFLRNPAIVGNWLYGVAFRVALRAKRSSTRRKTREVTMGVLPEQLAATPSTATPELTPILDAELAALPTHYREAIVLCDLRGISREEAATALGIPEGTLSSRLANGRKKLAARLTKRGVTLSVVAIPGAITEAVASVSVPNELITKTCGLVADWSADSAVPHPFTRLTDGGFPVRKTLMFVGLMSVIVVGVVFAARPGDDPPPDNPPKRPAAEKKLEAKSQPELSSESAKFTTKPRMRQMLDINISQVHTLMWNSSGTHIVISGYEQLSERNVRSMVWLLGVKPDSKPVMSPLSTKLVGVLPEGNGIITALREYSLISGRHQLKIWTEQKAPNGLQGNPPPTLAVTRTIDLDLPETHECVFARDMKTFRVVTWLRDSMDAITNLEVLEVDTKTGKVEKSLLKVEYGEYAMSDNGKRLAVLNKDTAKVVVYDLDRGTKLAEQTVSAIKQDRFSNKVVPGAINGVPSATQRRLLFSPDGKQLLVTRNLEMALLNAETGDILPKLEGIVGMYLLPSPGAFTGNGRLLALSVRRFGFPAREGPGGRLHIDFLTVWDTQSGKILKRWACDQDTGRPNVAFNPTQPVLAIAEPKGNQTRIGFWDFAAEVEKK